MEWNGTSEQVPSDLPGYWRRQAKGTTRNTGSLSSDCGTDQLATRERTAELTGMAERLGQEKRLAAYVVNYADDLVICCRGRAEEALATMRDIMGKLKLTVNETKTRVCKLPEEKFDFLGYTFGRSYSQKTGRAYLGTVPSKKRMIRICEAISAMTGRDQTLLEQEIVVAKLNRTMIGWANYFCLGPVGKAVESHACKRLRQWLCAKHKVMSGTKRFSEVALYDVRGLVRLTKRTRTLPWATS
jgi:RNA-directed DNA polymerase